MKFNKKLLYGLPIVLGGYLIYRQFSKGKRESQDVQPYITPTPSVSVPNDFPLRKGVKNKTVGTLQALLNTALKCKNKTLLVADNDFGSKTENALKELTGKTTVNSASELDQIKNQLSTVCNLSANLNKAWALIDAQKTGKFSFLMVKKQVTLYKVVKDFTGKWVTAAPSMKLTMPVKNYSLNDYVLRSATTTGGLRIEIMRGEFSGMWMTESGTDIVNTFNII